MRHGVAVAALAACLIAPIGTTWWMHAPEHKASSTTAEPATAPPPPPAMVESMVELNATEMDVESASEPQASTFSSTVASYQTRLAPYLPYAVAIWALGATGFAFRLAGGWWWTRRLRAHSEPAPAHWQEQVRRYANEMDLATSVPLRWAAGVSSPLVVGWWQPVLLVPLGFLSGMPPHHVEMVLRHELAHIRRNDMLVNALQRLAETLLFFHPGVWWLSAQITREREWCCDDLAIADEADRIAYATALSQLAASKQSWGLAAADGSLLTRVQRILQGDASVPVRPRWGLGRAAVVLMGSLGLAACASSGLLGDEADSNTEETAEATTPLMPSSPLSSLEPTVPPAPPEPHPTEPHPTEPHPTEPHPTEPHPTEPLPADPAETAPSAFNPSSGHPQQWAEADTTDWDSVRQAHREWREAWAEADTTDWDSVRQAHREWREAWAEADTTDWDSVRQAHREWREAWDSDTTDLGRLRQGIQEWQKAWDTDTTELGQLRQELQEWQEQNRQQRRLRTPYGECEQVEGSERQIHFGDSWVRADIHALKFGDPSDVEQIVWYAYDPETETRGEMLHTTHSLEGSCQPVPKELESDHLVGRVYSTSAPMVFDAYVDNTDTIPEILYVSFE